jgi:hypothetical protein
MFRGGDTYRGKRHFNEVKQCWEGNPADSADIYDVLSSVKHKASAEGGDQTHSMVMTTWIRHSDGTRLCVHWILHCK